jgi:hypothetical protein
MAVGGWVRVQKARRPRTRSQAGPQVEGLGSRPETNHY